MACYQKPGQGTHGGLSAAGSERLTGEEAAHPSYQLVLHCAAFGDHRETSCCLWSSSVKRISVV